MIPLLRLFISGSGERPLPFSTAIVGYTSLCLTPKKKLSLKTGVKTLDNQQMLEMETLINESYALCTNLKQMMLHFQNKEVEDKYIRLMFVRNKATHRYNRRWQKYTRAMLTV